MATLDQIAPTERDLVEAYTDNAFFTARIISDEINRFDAIRSRETDPRVLTRLGQAMVEADGLLRQTIEQIDQLMIEAFGLDEALSSATELSDKTPSTITITDSLLAEVLANIGSSPLVEITPPATGTISGSLLTEPQADIESAPAEEQISSAELLEAEPVTLNLRTRPKANPKEGLKKPSQQPKEGPIQPTLIETSETEPRPKRHRQPHQPTSRKQFIARKAYARGQGGSEEPINMPMDRNKSIHMPLFEHLMGRGDPPDQRPNQRRMSVTYQAIDAMPKSERPEGWEQRFLDVQLQWLQTPNQSAPQVK
jgi:hypothetical protein